MSFWALSNSGTTTRAVHKNRFRLCLIVTTLRTFRLSYPCSMIDHFY
jgi:hypothetical protein